MLSIDAFVNFIIIRELNDSAATTGFVGPWGHHLARFDVGLSFLDRHLMRASPIFSKMLIFLK